MIGAFLCLPALVLLSWERGGERDLAKRLESLAHGLVAGVCFGLFFVFLSRTGASSGIWPAFIARASSFTAVLAFAFFGRLSLSLAPGVRLSTIGAGLADMGANILFLLAARTGFLSIASILSSLYPAPTVVLARIFIKERIPLARAIGLGLSIAGVALISR
jgi:drug/metabolite transporter (DMT)-like permease